MNPGVSWEENGSSAEAMNDDLQEVELLGMKVGDENSAGAAKVAWHSELSRVFHNVRNV